MTDEQLKAALKACHIALWNMSDDEDAAQPN
jgi:hypothetical protein